MGVMSWQGLPVVTGSPWPGLRYFCTLRMRPGSAAAWPETADGATGASAAPYDTFNLGDHVGDDPLAVQANRDRLVATLPTAPLWLSQVHGVEVVDADKFPPVGAAGLGRMEEGGRPSTVTHPKADAVVSSVPGRVLCIMTADCLPVLLSDERAKVVGLAHAGWRGLAAGVLENTLATLRRRAPAGSSWRAWIGPAIGQAAFEVGDDVRQVFIDQDARTASCFTPGRPQRWQADLAGIASHRLGRAGVGQVETCGLCTHARPDFFYSYRRDGMTGRMATLAWLDCAA
ncbi:peptidoglycan editing factor PgeF [Pusillimonas sp.]|uniref:peptidoglycan editing factor PgeF n=1 Tax=Pusillimonas sp. TaxID=3040095 RepID=UPI0037C8EA85